jgi:hypothetical protein
MSVYKDTTFIRLPLLPRRYAHELLSVDEFDIEATLLAFYLEKNMLLKKAISSSTSSFFNEIEHRIKGENGLGELTSKLYSYTMRMSLRSTGFGVMSSITLARLSSEPKYLLDKEVLNVVMFKQDDKDTNQRYLINPTIYKLGDRYFFHSWTDQGEIRNFYLKSIKHDSMIEQLVLIMKEPRTLNIVMRFLKAVSADQKEIVQNLINRMHSEGFLILSDTNLDLRALNADVVDFQSISLEKLQIISQENNIYDVVSYRESNETTVDIKVAQKIKKTAQKLNDIFSHVYLEQSYHQLLSKFKGTFIEEFSDREVSLLSVLDPNSGVGFGNGDDLNISKFNEKFVKYLKKNSSSDSIMLSGEWKLSNEDIVTMSSLMKTDVRHKSRSAEFYSCLKYLEFKENGISKEYLKISPCGEAIAPYYRFNNISNAFKSRIEKIVKTQFKDKDEVIYVDLEHYPSRRISSYTRRAPITKYYIPITGFSTDPERKAIFLSDLFVTVISNRVVLRSKKLNKIIIPVCLHNYNFIHDPLPMVRFLLSVAKQDSPGFLKWIWPSEMNQAFFPRVSYQGVVVSPKKWIFDKHFLLNSLDKKPFRDFYNIPHIVNIVDDDRFIAVNLENCSISVPLIRRLKSDQVVLEESIELVGDSDGYCSEVSITCTLNHSKSSVEVLKGDRLSLRRNKILLGVLDGYYVVNIQLHPELRFECLEELRSVLPEKWFYIFYMKNKKYELRIRCFNLLEDEIDVLRRNTHIVLNALKIKNGIIHYYEEYYESDEELLKEDVSILPIFYHHSSDYFVKFILNENIDTLFINHMVYTIQLERCFGHKINNNSKKYKLTDRVQSTKKNELIAIFMSEKIELIPIEFPKVKIDEKRELILRIIHMNCLRIDCLFAPAMELATYEILNLLSNQSDAQ